MHMRRPYRRLVRPNTCSDPSRGERPSDESWLVGIPVLPSGSVSTIFVVVDDDFGHEDNGDDDYAFLRACLRLPKPRSFLDDLPALVKPGGVAVLISPYSWLAEYTNPSVRTVAVNGNGER